MERVLALSLRPKCLSDLIGQNQVIDTLTRQFDSKRIPHFFIISGPVGAGKTTLARIIAARIHAVAGASSVGDDTLEVNAANKNGVDDVRSLINTMRFKPFPPSVAKVVILDEAHQLTIASQNAMLTETEDLPDHAFYLFCTSTLTKIIPGLRRRAYILTPRPLCRDTVGEMIERARNAASFEGSITPLMEAIEAHEVSAPGLILQAAERFFSGADAIESITAVPQTSLKVNTAAVCAALSRGDWSACAEHIASLGRSDVTAVRTALLTFLKGRLISEQDGEGADSLARAMDVIARAPCDDFLGVPAITASLCMACQVMRRHAQTK